jgi:hypothetical protein
MQGIDLNMNIVFNVPHAANKIAATEQSALPEISQIIGNSPRVASPTGDKARKVARVTAFLISRDDAGETGNNAVNRIVWIPPSTPRDGQMRVKKHRNDGRKIRDSPERRALE